MIEGNWKKLPEEIKTIKPKKLEKQKTDYEIEEEIEQEKKEDSGWKKLDPKNYKI
ncbi:MAG TPA: hypothetical protein PKZ36_01335 [Candidatus Paceibacterota bacterium]|nr:hypothetical protein [Candidatus Paceibacterota bacterium]HPT18029.1 hypothetical protein [Candidatus Paceibacterota bacterium]